MTGNVQKRGKNSWRLTVSGGFDSEGKRIRHTKTIKVAGKTEKTQRKNAEHELSLFIAEVERGEHFGSGKMTLKEFSEKWLKEYAEKELAPKTYYRYKELLDSRINPKLGHYELVKIKPMHLLEFYSYLQEDGIRKDGKPGGLSPETVRHHHRLLSTIFSTACQWQVMKDNPASRVKPPKVSKVDVAFYDEEQTATLLEALEKEPLKFKVAVMVALTTGCRRGELMGLEWPDIDFENNFITINRSFQYVTGLGCVTKVPKNESSKRTVPVPGSTMKLLKKHQAEQRMEEMKLKNIWKGTDRVFTTWDGSPMFPDTVTGWFCDFIERHSLPKITFHGLRHTAATLLIGKGVQDLTVSALLGHADPGTTKRIYAKSLKSSERAAADMMEDIVNKKDAK